MIRSKKYWQNELKDVDTIYVVGIKRGTNAYYDRGIWRKFRLYYIKNGELREIWIEDDDHPPEWIPRHKTRSCKWVGGYFESRVLGMDRTFQIVYSLGRWLYGDGYKFKVRFLSYEH